MIRAYKKNNDKERIERLMKNNMFQNVYLYIDIQVYGFLNDNVKTYFAEENNQIVAIIYFYYNNIQLLEVSYITETIVKEIADLILCNKVKRISGKVELIQKLRNFIEEDCFETDGYIMKYVSEGKAQSLIPCFASEDDIHEIAILIYNDSHLGRGYEFQDLFYQLRNRFLYDGCENVCIRKDGRIVSHFATYAVANNIAVLSGMVTDPKYRGKGYGSTLVHFLSEHVVNSGRMPVLYCYQDEYLTWYQKLGYNIIETSSKLEINYGVPVRRNQYR